MMLQRLPHPIGARAAALALGALLAWGTAAPAGAQAAAPAPVPEAPAASGPEGAAARPRQVFIVFDVVMEAAALEGAAGDAARAHLQRGFDTLLPLLQAWGRQHRVGIDAALFLERRKIDLKEGVYSHLLIEKLTREARSDGPEGARFSDRRWSAQGFAIHSDRARAPRALGNEHYSSEALSCFAAAAPDSTAAACRHAYLDKLSAHLRWIDPALGTLQARAD
jgi:hypothetical protein